MVHRKIAESYAKLSPVALLKAEAMILPVVILGVLSKGFIRTFH